MHKKIIDLITLHYPNVTVIYLFGSQASGKQTKNSDWDIALLTTRKLAPLARWELSESLCELLDSQVDLVDLLEASTVLQMQVITTGQVLFDKEPSAALFEMQVFSMYGRLQEGRSDIIKQFINETKNA